MPTYQYACESCGYEFEKFQSIKDDPLKKCPKCSGKVDRLIGTGGGILFKGKGFYQTDYRSRGYQEAASKDSSTPKPCSENGCPNAGSCPAKQ